MSFKKKIVKNIGFVSIGEAISSLLSYFLIIYIARLLGSEGLGVYSFAFAFVGLFGLFYDFGITAFFIKEVSYNRKNIEKYFGNYASLKLVFCIIAMLLPMISIIFLKRSLDVNIIVYLASISLFFQNYSYVARNTFQAYQEMHYDAFVRIAERIIAFTLGLYVLSSGYGLTAFLLVLVFSNLVSLIISIIFLKKIHVDFNFKVDYSMWKNILKNSWPFWLSFVFIQIYFQVDTVMLSFMKGYEATGLYNAAYKLINAVAKIPWIVVAVLFPVMSELYANLSKEPLKKVLEKGMHVMAIVSIPMIIGVSLLADRIIFFIYKDGFHDSAIVLKILIWTTIFVFLSNIIGWFLNAINMQKIFTYTTGISLIINVILNALLIPYFSYIGASIATLVTTIINFLLLYYFNMKSGYYINIVRLTIKPLMSSVVMGMFIFFFGSRMHILLLIPISVIIYFSLLALMGDIKKDDFNGFLNVEKT